MTQKISNSPIRLLIADDHAIVREGMNFLASTRPDIEIVGEAEDGLHAVELAGALKPAMTICRLSNPAPRKAMPSLSTSTMTLR